MANLKDIIKLTESQYNTLKTTGSITVGGVTYTYSADNIYLVDAEKKYRHDVSITYNGSYESCSINFNFINTRSTEYTDNEAGWNSLVTDIYYSYASVGEDQPNLSATGYYKVSSPQETFILGLQYINAETPQGTGDTYKLQLRGLDFDYNANTQVKAYVLSGTTAFDINYYNSYYIYDHVTAL